MGSKGEKDKKDSQIISPSKIERDEGGKKKAGKKSRQKLSLKGKSTCRLEFVTSKKKKKTRWPEKRRAGEKGLGR